MSEMNYMEKQTASQGTESIDSLECAPENHKGDTVDENIENGSEMTEEEFRAQYKKLPVWQHVILVILFLFGLTAAIMVIDFVVEFFTEFIKHIV